MTTCLRFQVNIPNDVPVPANVAMNTWHFSSGAVDRQDDVDTIAPALTAFYQAIDGNFSGGIDSPAVVKVYDLVDPQPRVPFTFYNMTLAPSAGARFPNEVAICLSYNAPVVSGENPRRARGRIYLGPWSNGAGESGVGDARVTPTQRGIIQSAAVALQQALVGGTANWVVFSPTEAGSEPWDETALVGAMRPVYNGYIDDAFDTVRSRGLAPTARTIWTGTLP